MWFEFLRIALNVLRTHKFRAALTVLSITLGAFGIVVMSSLARSAIATLAQGVEDSGGARFVVFFPQRPERAERKQGSYLKGLTLEDLEVLRQRVPHARYFETHTDLDDEDLRGTDGRTARVEPVAGNPDFLGAFAMRISVGRTIDDRDMTERARVTVLGHKTAVELYGSPAAAIDQVLRIQGDAFRVVGVVAEVKRFGVEFGFDWNEFAWVPFTAVRSQGAHILIVSEDARHNAMIFDLAASILSARHRGVDDFRGFDFAVVLERFYKVFRIMQLIVAGLAAVALVVGGVGVMNILLVSVRERVREIGVRKAIGASPPAIRAQFLCEAALLSTLGGALGVAAGLGTALVAGAIIRRTLEIWVTRVALEGVVGALAASLLVGLVFGALPARRAARLEVVECLRS